MTNNRKINVNVRKPASYRYGEKLPADSAMLEELLKGSDFQQLFESFYNFINIPVAIIDFNANVLFSSPWQRICTQYHRVHPATCDRCIESDTQLATQLQEGKSYAIYSCRNGLTDSAAPIIIEGKRVANVFIGQFLTKEPDENWFRQQAEALGFDVADYLAALHEVPIVDAARIPLIIDLLMRMTSVITNLAIDRKRAIESQARQAIILNTIPQAVFWKDTQGRYLGCNTPFARDVGLATPGDIVGKTDFDLPWPRQEAEAYRADDQAVISANQPKLHIVEPVQQADGSRIVADTSKIPLVDAANTPYGLVGIYEDITERRRAEEALRESEAYRRAIFESARDAILIMRDERFIDCNPSALSLYGTDRESFIGHAPYEFSPERQPDGRLSKDSALKKIAAALQGEPQFFEWKHTRKDGTPFDVEVSLNRINFGKEDLIQATVRDVSARKRADEALRENELKYRALFETADDAILLFTGDRWVDCNAAALRVYGCTREQIVGAHPSRFSPPTQPDGRSSGELSAERISLAYANKPQEFEWVHCRADGTLFDAEVHLNRVDLGGKPFIQAIVRDVSFRKKAEEALKKSEERFQLSMEATSDGLWDWNAVTNEVYYSPACYYMLGYEVGDFPGTLQGWQDLLHPDDIEHTMQANMDCVEGRSETFSVEYRLKARNGKWHWILGRGKSIARDAQGRSLRLVGTNSDITERKQMEIALTETQTQIQAVMNSTDDMIWAVDPVRYGLLTFNQGLKRYFERLNVDCQIGMTPEQLLPAAFAVQWHEIYARALREGSYVIEYRASSGANILMLTVNVMKRGEEMFGISVFAKDITESKQAQARILKLSRLYATLSHTNTTIVHSTGREELFRDICAGAVEHGKFLMAWVGLVDEQTHRVIPCCHAGAENGYLANIVISTDDIPEGRGPTGTAIRENRICYINNFLTDERIRPWSEAASKRGFQSAVGLPLRLAGKVIGAMTLYSGEPDYFDAEQLALMDEMSTDISFALDNFAREAERMQAEQKVKGAYERVAKTLDDTIVTMAKIVEMRDPYTAGHQERVTSLAVAIAKEMNLGAEQIDQLRMAAIIHDIGKINIAAEILSKPGKLSRLEMQMIMTHAQSGYEIVKNMNFLPEVAQAILQHHERLDGSGYPNGLKGDDICMEAKILSVADVVEATASHRPYRPARGIDAALAEISKNSGKLYDSEVCNACLKLFNEKRFCFVDKDDSMQGVTNDVDLKLPVNIRADSPPVH